MPETFRSVSNVTFPQPVSKLESVCTETPDNSANLFCEILNVSRRSITLFPMSFLFIKMNIIKIFAPPQDGKARNIHFNEIFGRYKPWMSREIWSAYQPKSA